jgi:hypothetical protein
MCGDHQARLLHLRELLHFLNLSSELPLFAEGGTFFTTLPSFDFL